MNLPAEEDTAPRKLAANYSMCHDGAHEPLQRIVVQAVEDVVAVVETAGNLGHKIVALQQRLFDDYEQQVHALLGLKAEKGKGGGAGKR